MEKTVQEVEFYRHRRDTPGVVSFLIFVIRLQVLLILRTWADQAEAEACATSEMSPREASPSRVIPSNLGRRSSWSHASQPSTPDHGIATTSEQSGAPGLSPKNPRAAAGTALHVSALPPSSSRVPNTQAAPRPSAFRYTYGNAIKKSVWNFLPVCA